MAQAFRTQNLRLLASILDANDNELIKSPSPVASAVNELTITNAATSVSPSISATGDDTHIGLNLISKGTGLIQINGKAISLANSFTTSGNFALTFNTTAATTLDLPASGLLATTDQIPTVNNATLTLAGSGGIGIDSPPTFTANASADKTITITIADAALTLAKLANIGGSTILGNSAPSSAGAPAALSVATVASMLSNQTMNIVGTATSVTDIVLVAKGGTGVATANANTIFVGPSTGAAAGPSFRAMVTADIPTGIVTYDKIQYVANTARVLGRISSLSGEIEELTGANIVTIIDTNAVSRATNLAGGIAGQIPYQSGANTTLFSAAGALSQVLLSGAAGAPTWASQSTLSVGSATTAGSVTNALTISSPLTGTSYNGSTAISIGLQNASDTLAGGVSIGPQTFAGNKTFKDSVIVSGDLTVNGTTITINSSTLSVDDKNIELGAVIAIASLSSAYDINAGSDLVIVNSTTGLIVGQALTKTGGTGAFGASPTIASIISATQFTVTPVHATTGSIIFSVGGATDVTADGGGITLKGTTNKTIIWVDSTDAWTLSEHLNIASGKVYRINGTDVLSSTTLGSGVVNSSLTSVGTLANLTVTNAITGSVSGSAASLSNIRTFWGRDFNGTQDVSGNLTSVGNITGTSGITITAGGSNQNVVLTPTGTGYTLLNGNVGIGTASPEAILQVANTGRILGVLRLQITPRTTFYDHTFAIDNDGGGAQGFIYTSGTGGTFPLNTYGELILQAGPRTGFNNGISLVTGTTSPSVKLRIEEGGNVGIGTTVPGTSLEVYAIPATSTTLRQMLIINTDFASATGTGFGGSIVFRGRTPGNLLRDNAQISAYNEDIGDNGYALGFYTRPSDGGGLQQRLTILRAGNVGIGITTPVAKLHIVTTGTNDGIILDGSSNPIFVHRTSGSDRTYLSTVTSAGAFFTDASQYDFIIRSQANNILFGRGSGTSTMAVVGSNVGIGTVAPVAKLHINSTTAGETVLRSDGTNGTLFSVVDDLSDSLMSVNNSAGLPVLEVFADDRIVAGQYGQNDFVVINNKVGLGANSPINKLSVIGSASIGDSTYNVSAPTNGLIVQGNVGIGTVSPTNGTLQVYNASGNTLSLQKAAGGAALAMGSETTVYALIESVDSGGIRFYTGNGSQTERWKITSAGVLESNGAQTIRTSINSLTLATNGANGNIILSPHGNGNVGIGDTTTTAKLDVNGTVRIRSISASGSDGTIFLTTNGTGILVSRTAAEVRSDIGAGTGNGTVTGVTATSPLEATAGNAPVISLSGIVPIANGGTGAATAAINTIFAGPSSGSTAAPSFRAMVSADIPSGAVTYAKIQNTAALSVIGVAGVSVATVAAITGSANQVLRVSDDGTALAFGAINLGSAFAVTGLLPIANGGTGIGTTAANAFFVGPDSTTGAPSFRAIVSADIPSSITLTTPVIGNIKMGYTTTATAAGTTALTVSSNHYQRFTGSTTQTITLPVTSTLVAGMSYVIENVSTGLLTVNSSGGNLVVTVIPGVTVNCLCVGIALTTAADWDVEYDEFASITGTGSVVLSLSPTLVTPALGVPASGDLSNCTGTAVGLTANTVTTNANLTGPVTSSGNATAITNSAVSYSNIQNVNPNKVLGRITNSVGIVEELSGANIATIIGSSAITNASNVTIATDDSTASSYYLYFGANITGNTPLKASTKIRYNPSTGAFSATTKSFRIPHPTKLEHDLVYGSLESPYHGIRLTGKGKTKGNRAEIFLPDYVKSLIDEETVNIQLTVIKCAKILYIENIIIDDNKFTVKYDKPWYEKCKDIEFYWDFTAERKDVPKLIVEEKI